MIERILPDTVAVRFATANLPGAVLLSDEEELAAKMVAPRRAEFATTRHCARQALADLGLPPTPIGRGSMGQPQWPAGVVGSLTHCVGYRAAVVASSRSVRSIGIDAENAGPLPEAALEEAVLPIEREHLADLRRHDRDVHWDRLLFSAKESVYKAWFPLAECWLGFEDVQVTFHPEDGGFTARLRGTQRVSGGVELTGFTGRWLAVGNLVLTSVVVPAETHHANRLTHGA